MSAADADDDLDGDGAVAADGNRDADTTGGTLDGSVVREILADAFPDWTLEDWQAADEGTDFVAFLDCETPGGPERAVLKAQSFLDPVSFRPEPRVLHLVADRTSIPVPEVLASDLEEDGAFPPYFIMTYVEGDQPSSLEALSDDALERVAREAGTHLAQIHEMATWDAYGSIRHADDVEDYDGRTPGGLAVWNGESSWRAALAAGADGQLDRYGERFTDLEPALREAAHDVLADVPDHPRCSLVHGDYRLGNLLVDIDTGETRAVLDWGNQFTGDPAYDRVKTEDYLCGYAPRDHPRRLLVRDAIREGYREVRDLTLDPDRREAYLLHSRIPAFAWFDLWYGDADDPASIEAKHREFVDPYR